MEFLWYLMRGTGVALLILLTLTTVMGVLSTARLGSPVWPRFLTQQLHRNISVIALALLSVHVLTAVTDSYVDIRWYEAFWFRSGAYGGAWLWLGTLTCDLMIILAATSLFRARLPHRVWRGIHLLAYLSWLAAVLHGAGIGTDTTTAWGMGTIVASVGVVAAFAVIRFATWTQERRLA
jgi:predicted ferric reductase